MEADMHISSRTIATTLSALVLVAIALPAQETTPPTQTPTGDIAHPVIPAQDSTPVRANSKVRIVRLSEIRGAVQLDRNTGRGFEEAMVNLPIVEQARLQTGTGVAEVEFEDNSTLRLAPDSLVEFSQLELLPSGAKASTVTLRKGTVYASLVNTKGNEFTLIFNQQKIHLQPSSHVRIQLQPKEATLAVLDGSVSVEGPSGTTQVGKKKTLTFDLTNQNPPVEAKNVAPEPFDSWDHNSAEYHKSFASQSAFGSSPYSYGVSDMLYYGSFANTGCGSLWQPYFVSAAWDPFANGTWAWYPGAGYSWVSPYPWGWMPYHYGNWISCAGTGWGWQPGGAWYGLNNGLVSTKVNGQPVHRPSPSNPPVLGQSTLVHVSLKPLTASDFASHQSFVFRNDSAGLGIPRGTFGKLNEFSDQAEHHGSVTTPVYFPSASTASGSGRPENARLDSSRSGNAEYAQSGRSSISASDSSIGRSSSAPGSAPTAGSAAGSSRGH
jgi:hypothetical protein